MITPSAGATALPASSRSSLEIARDLVSLSKPRITALVALTAAVGFSLAPGSAPLGRLWLTLLGLVLVVSGANGLNQFLERDVDRLMTRTCRRPLAAGRLSLHLALAVTCGAALVGLVTLATTVGSLVTLLAACALATYVAAYTPLKRLSPLSLLVGAVPGALPPLIGAAAATGTIESTGLALFSIQFLWQVPHFLALAVLYRDQYARAGIQVLPVASTAANTRRQIVIYTFALVGVTLGVASIVGAGRIYLFAAGIFGAVFLLGALWGLRVSAGLRWARALFFLSLIYLPALLGALMLDVTL